MIELKKFTKSDFDTLISWIKNEEDLVQFSGPIFSFPLTESQLSSYIKMTDKRIFKIVNTSTNTTIGHCELNYTNGNNRLSRILIGDKNSRGKGYCKIIIAKMTTMLFEDLNVNEVDLNVFDWNKGAIKCYQNAGFIIDTKTHKKQTVKGEVWTCLNMKLHRNNWLQHTL